METRIQYIFLVIGLLLISIVTPTSVYGFSEENTQENTKQETQVWDEASAITEPEIKRQKIDVSTIDAQDIEIGVFFGQMNVEDFGTNAVSGVTLAYHVTEDIFAEVSLGQTDTELTSFEIISGSRLLTDDERKYKYYDLSLGINLLPGEGFIGENYAFTSSFYGLLGVGSTDFAGDQRFTVSGAVGYRVLLNDWISLHVEVKDHVFDIDILGEDKTTHNINYNIGFTVFF